MTSTDTSGTVVGHTDRSAGGPAARKRRSSRASTPFDWQALAVLTVVVALGAFVFGAVRGLGTISGLIVGPVLLAGSIPLVVAAAKHEKRFDLVGLMLFSFALRLLVAVPRRQGAVDATVYHGIGMQLAESFRSFHFAVDTGSDIPGTGSVRYVSGLVHVLTFDNFFGAFLVFTFMAFWGTWFFYKAFTLAVPEGNHYRYAKLIFLWPSVLFWTSSLGKEAIVCFTIGLTALGIALMIRRRWSGLLVFVPGLVGTMMVRPHMALAILVPLIAALLVPRSREGSSFGLGVRILGIVGLLVAGSLVAHSVESFLKIENLNSAGIDQALNTTEANTTQGGSNFAAARVRTPADYPYAVVTVMLRPFPFEAHTAEALATSLEGLLLVALAIASLPTLIHIPRLMARYSYVSFAVFYLLVFCFVFAVIGNFGILERERTQALPFVFVLLALPPVARQSKGRIVGSIERLGKRGRAGVSPGDGDDLRARPLPEQPAR